MVQKADRLQNGLATIGLALEEGLKHSEGDNLGWLDANAEDILWRGLTSLLDAEVDLDICLLDLMRGPGELVAIEEYGVWREDLGHGFAAPDLHLHHAGRGTIVVDNGDIVLLDRLRWKLEDVEGVQANVDLTAKGVELAIALGQRDGGLDLGVCQLVCVPE